jgi:hypothetical protein
MLSGLFARGLGLALVVLGTAACASASPKAEPKGPGAELDVARALFEDAVADEEQHRFAQALQKLEMIRGVRDTPAVRFRIASCLEGSYRLREARTAYAKVAEATQRSPEDDAVVTASNEKLGMLESRIPAILVQIADGKDADVRIDDEPVVSARGPLRVNPGNHHLAIMRKGYRTMDMQVRVGEGGRVKVYTMLVPEGQKAKPATPKRPKPMPPSASRAHEHPSRESGS